MNSLFDLIDDPITVPIDRWVPPEPPCLDGIDEIELDFETKNGKRWWDPHKPAMPIGVGVALPDGRTYYLPWGHRGGGNLDEAVVRRWFQQEVKHKLITNLSTKFEVHVARNWGLDFEEQGNIVSDVGHHAALLDDQRIHFSLESLVDDFLEDEKKVRTVNGHQLDVLRMDEYHAGVVAVRAQADVRQVQKLKHLFRPRLEAEGLMDVKRLEDDVIYPTAEMERNGAPIDVDLLDRWVIESERQVTDCLMGIFKITGLRVNPDSGKDMLKLFEHLGLPIERTDPTPKKPNGSPSFTAAILKRISHPAIVLALRAARLQDVRQKYLLRYARTVDRTTGLLRYSLHQLRGTKDENDPNDQGAGTISGRYSSTKIDKDADEGANIQQVFKVEKQRVVMGFDEDDVSHDDELYIIRRLFRPANRNHRWLSADAMQIEFRLFADKSKSKRLTGIYDKNPMASFHKETHIMLKEYNPDLTYRRNKDFNFANVYGAGLRKRALMMDLITVEQYLRLLKDPNWHESPLLKEAKKIGRIYDQLIPEVKPLLDRAMHLAMPFCNERCRKSVSSRRLHRDYDHRGYVRTLLGRRTRFPNGMRVHKAFNSVIQGSAADIMKMKLVELHRERRHTGFLLRFTVHDEVDGDIQSSEGVARVRAILNRQSVSLSVPILWEVSTGQSWADVDQQEDEFDGVARTDPQRQTTQNIAKARAAKGIIAPLPVPGRGSH